MRGRLPSLALLGATLGCASAPRVEEPHAAAPPSAVADARPARSVSLPSGTRLPDAARLLAAETRAAGLGCDAASFVWGDLRALDSARPLRVTLEGAGEGASLSGWLVCDAELPSFLRAQSENPRLKASHGGAADLRFIGGQFLLARTWGKPAPLGNLDTEPEAVLQKGELLAAIFNPCDVDASLASVLPALRRVPRFFLFGLWPLTASPTCV